MTANDNFSQFEESVHAAIRCMREYFNGIDSGGLGDAVGIVNSLRVCYAIEKKRSRNNPDLNRFHTYILDSLLKASNSLGDLFMFDREDIANEAERYLRKAKASYRSHESKANPARVSFVSVSGFFQYGGMFSGLEFKLSNDNNKNELLQPKANN